MSNLLFDTLLGSAPAGQPFLELVDGTRITYGQLNAEVSRAAAALTMSHVRPGDRVAAQVDKSAAALVLYLATIKVGAIFLPLNTAYTAAELQYFIEDATPSVFVCRTDSESVLRPLTDDTDTCLYTLDEWGEGGSWPTLLNTANSAPDPAANRGHDDLAAILYTSGTTGRPKGAMLTHGNLASNAETLARCWRFSTDDVLLHALPIFHTHGLFVAVNTVMVSGASMIFLPRFNPSQVIKLMPRATVLMGVPTFYTRLLKEPELNADVTKGMRLFVSGSAPLLEDTHHAFRERTDHTILERYGMTETCMNTSNPYDNERRPGTVGPPLPGVEVRVRDPDTGEPLPRGEVGMLEVRGPNVFKGYWGMPERTEEEFTEDDFFITGDLGFIDQAGYVAIVGRGKDLIISGGFNVYPKEVEREIDALQGVEESAVVGVPHPDFGEGVVAVVVPQAGVVLDETTIITGLGDRLARYKHPKRVVFVDELPRNTMGKVQKNLLRKDCEALFAR